MKPARATKERAMLNAQKEGIRTARQEARAELRNTQGKERILKDFCHELTLGPTARRKLNSRMTWEEAYQFVQEFCGAKWDDPNFLLCERGSSKAFANDGTPILCNEFAVRSRGREVSIVTVRWVLPGLNGGSGREGQLTIEYELSQDEQSDEESSQEDRIREIEQYVESLSRADLLAHHELICKRISGNGSKRTQNRNKRKRKNKARTQGIARNMSHDNTQVAVELVRTATQQSETGSEDQPPITSPRRQIKKRKFRNGGCQDEKKRETEATRR